MPTLSELMMLRLSPADREALARLAQLEERRPAELMRVLLRRAAREAGVLPGPVSIDRRRRKAGKNAAA